VLTRRIGPLPAWTWITIVAAGVIGWAWLANRKQQQASAQVPADQVPDFINQTYTSVTPPSVVYRDRDDDDLDDRRHKRKHPEDRDADDKRKRRRPRRPPVHEPEPTRQRHHRTVTATGPRGL
jgi:hypothetical protein